MRLDKLGRSSGLMHPTMCNGLSPHQWTQPNSCCLSPPRCAHSSSALDTAHGSWPTVNRLSRWPHMPHHWPQDGTPPGSPVPGESYLVLRPNNLTGRLQLSPPPPPPPRLTFIAVKALSSRSSGRSTSSFIIPDPPFPFSSFNLICRPGINPLCYPTTINNHMTALFVTWLVAGHWTQPPVFPNSIGDSVAKQHRNISIISIDITIKW